MSPIPSTASIPAAIATKSEFVDIDGSSQKQLRQGLRLDFSSSNCSSSKKQCFSSDLLSIIKKPGAGTPTPTTLLYPSDVTLAQRQYAQGFLDALTHIQQLNGFVPTPTLGSPSLFPGLIQSIVSTASSSEPGKVITSPVLSPTAREPFSVIMQAAMSGMSGLAYPFPQLGPSPLSYGGGAQMHPVMPSTSSVGPVPPPAEIKAEACLNASDESKESSYDMCFELNNDTEACSSTRSNNSPRSQDELFVGPFSSDSYDAMEQERRKLERKRARNRMAATKCRQRKLQRISELEKQVSDEKTTGSRLSQELKALETTIAQLRQTLHEHRSRGCVVPSK